MPHDSTLLATLGGIVAQTTSSLSYGYAWNRTQLRQLSPALFSDLGPQRILNSVDRVEIPFAPLVETPRWVVPSRVCLGLPAAFALIMGSTHPPV
jgi:hypothetical protein